MGGKSSGKNVLGNPLHNLLENLLNTRPVLTVFIGLILGTLISIFFFFSYFYLREGNGIPLQYSCLENPMDGGAW